jgi:hypothetical protein
MNYLYLFNYLILIKGVSKSNLNAAGVGTSNGSQKSTMEGQQVKKNYLFFK